MQIILPTQHPILGGILLLFLFALGLIGTILLSLGIRMILKRSKKKLLQLSFIIFGGMMTAFVLYNWINYNLIYSRYENKYIGTYINRETNYEFDLKSDNRWSSTYERIKCNHGHWKFVITEDVSYLELEGEC